MELQVMNNQNGIHPASTVNNSKFIEANTQAVTLDEIRDKHLIPVFVKDNTPTISQAEFIGSTVDIVVKQLNTRIDNLAVRVSHPIKGRIYEARNKKASELKEHEKTLYYERMAFSFDIPSITDTIHGKDVTLSIVGVKAYNQDNLYGYGNGLQRFKLGIGFKVKVCTNMCLFTDGTALDLKVRNLSDLQSDIELLVNEANFIEQARNLNLLGEYHLSQKQFATILGKSRMYNHLHKEDKENIPELLVSDSQVSMVTKSYYNDLTFPKNKDGSISLWNLYNHYTNAVKSSYIDTFIDRNLSASNFTNGIKHALDGDNTYKWFLE